MPELQDAASTEAGRLLRVLLVRLGAVSSSSGTARMLWLTPSSVAEFQVSKLLANSKVWQAIAERQQAKSKELGITRERGWRELARISFAQLPR
jgi:hypothetical protein